MNWIKDRIPIVLVFAILTIAYVTLVFQNQSGNLKTHNYKTTPLCTTSQFDHKLQTPCSTSASNSHSVAGSTITNDHNISNAQATFQQRSVEAAEKANIFSKAQTWINGIGLFLLLLTTWFAWGAWQAGKAGVTISQNTLAETQTANKRGQRAYVGVKAFNYHFIPITDDQASLAVSSSIVNFGQTPAYDQKNSTQIKIVDASEEGNIDTAPLDAAGITLFPNTEPKLTVNLVISASDVIALRKMTKKLFVIVHITYEDIFGEQHWSKTQYTLRYIGQGNKFTTEHGGALTYYSEENNHKNRKG